jgi:predicted tellurium resistance membrane protein TerC
MIEFSTSSIISLIFLEIILSIDNLIFISMLVGKMDKKYREITKIIGLGVALTIRLCLFFSVNNLLSMDKSFFYIGSMEITYREFIFIIGGLFLIYKSTGEAKQIVMNEKKNEQISEQSFYANKSPIKKFFFAILQIIIIDLIFSIDSVIVAIAISPNMHAMIIATLVSMATLLVSTNFLSKILIKYPSLKLLAMSFIIAIGIIFVLDGFEIHIERSYIHFALVFALIFECFDIIRIKNLDEKNI